MINNIRRLKTACYTVNITMSVVANLPPVLFLTFRTLYNISFTLLGFLILVNYVTQLFVDLIFSFFSHKFNITKVVKSMPYLSFLGLGIYSIYPLFFPQSAYIGLVLGTIIFSAACGLAEVLISPIIAAIPSDDPDREMSKLHSVYAWGVVPVILITTLFIYVFSGEYWHWLVWFFMLIPFLSIILFSGCSIPYMTTAKQTLGVLKFLKNKTVWLLMLAIFIGGAAECTMAQWASGFLEMSFNIPKVYGDIFGVMLFAIMLGIGRTLYAKYGSGIEKILILGIIGAAFCYFAAAVSDSAYIGLAACALTGFCTSMLWPGTLVLASDRFASSGVVIYALMAAGGDMGAALVPQLIGFITDFSIANPVIENVAYKLSLMPQQLGMKLGILIAALIPVLGIFVYGYFWKKRKIN